MILEKCPQPAAYHQKNNNYFRKHILDALPDISNAAAVALMKDIILKNGVPQDKVEDWLLSIGFIRRPDESMLESLVQLLENRPNEAAVALSISALTRSYCIQNNDCIQNEQVNKIVNLLQDAVLAYKTDKRTRQTEDAVSIAFATIKFAILK